MKKQLFLLTCIATLLPLSSAVFAEVETYTILPNGSLSKEMPFDKQNKQGVQSIPESEIFAKEVPLKKKKKNAVSTTEEILPPKPLYQVSILSDTANSYNAAQMRKRSDNIALANIKIAVDADNITLKNIVNDIVAQAAKHTGPWKVKWRLKPANQHILTQRVNLIAEGNFNEFAYHLTDRVKNMTGTQLFISHFDAARVAIISDTYY